MTIQEATARCKALVAELRKAGVTDTQIGAAMLAALGAEKARAAFAASPGATQQIASGLRAIRQVADIAREIESLSGPPGDRE